MVGEGPFQGATTAVTIVRVCSVASSVAWYRDHLGLEPVHVGADGPEHPIATYHVGGAFFTLWQLPPGVERHPDAADTTSYVCLLLGSEADLEAARRKLADDGVPVSPTVRSSANNRFFQFDDPDGNRWELAQAVSELSRRAADQLTGEHRSRERSR